MGIDWLFVANSILLGFGLSMDAFSISLANGLANPRMRPGRMALVAGTYAFFQAFMPMMGWFCVHTVLEYFQKAVPFIPWVALALLTYIGSGMIREGRLGGNESKEGRLSGKKLLLQGIATSIDALSVGFTIATYPEEVALACALIVAATTFGICFSGLAIGKCFGLRFSGQALTLGGAILIAIGLEIVATSLWQ